MEIAVILRLGLSVLGFVFVCIARRPLERYIRMKKLQRVMIGSLEVMEGFAEKMTGERVPADMVAERLCMDVQADTHADLQKRNWLRWLLAAAICLGTSSVWYILALLGITS